MLNERQKLDLISCAQTRSNKRARELREHLMAGRNPKRRLPVSYEDGFRSSVVARGGSAPRPNERKGCR